MKEKTITFRHLRSVECVKDSVSDEMLKNKLIEDCLVRGYVPMDIKFTDRIDDSVKVRVCHCLCGYAGKKQARIIGVQTPSNIISLLENK